MKQVAGTLRLDLAQYRELAAFAQFGSDLDKATQAQLSRGQRMVEILKQPQYQPMDVELQVASIYAGTKGYLDSLPVESVRPFEAGLHEFLTSQNKEILSAIISTGKLEKATEEALGKAIQDVQGPLRQGETAAPKAAEAKPVARAEVGRRTGAGERLAPGFRSDGLSHRHSTAAALGEEHAADHQGHEDGRRGEASPGPGEGDRREALRQGDARDLLASVSARLGEAKHPLLDAREEKRVLVMVVAGDRGLCGAFNTNVHRATAHLLAAHPEWQDVRILPVGKKAVDYWRRRKLPVHREDLSGDPLGPALRAREGDRGVSVREFLSERIDAVYVVVNEFRSILVAGRSYGEAPAALAGGRGSGRARAGRRPRPRRAALRAGLPDDPGVAAPALSRVHGLSSAGGIGRRRDGRPHDRDGLGLEERREISSTR